MWSLSAALSWAIVAHSVVVVVNTQLQCPDTHVACFNNNGTPSCFNETQVCVEVAPDNCPQLASSGLNVTCESGMLSFLCRDRDLPEVRISLQQICDGVADCPDLSDEDNASCSVEPQTYPPPMVTVSWVQGDSTRVLIQFGSSSNNSVVVPAGSYITFGCSANLSSYTVIWSAPFESELCGLVMSAGGRNWSQLATSTLNGTHTCSYMLGNTTAPVSTSVSVIVEGSGLFYRNGGIATPLLNNSIVFLENTSGSVQFELWCASDLGLVDMTAANYTHSFIGVGGVELNGGNSSGLYTLSSCGPSFVYNGTAFPPTGQGVYTCQVMVAGGYTVDLSVAFYMAGFSPGLSLRNLTLDSEADEFTLVCTTTGSPPTDVFWIFAGTFLPSPTGVLFTDGDLTIHYRTVQSVINRTLATYENKLILSSNLDPSMTNVSLFLGNHMCSVMNVITMFNPANTRTLNIRGLYFVNEEHVIGGRSKVLCVTDLPGIVVKWFVEGSSRTVNSSLGSSAELVFDPVSADLNGTLYTCVTLTYYGTQEKQLLIRVVEPPTPVCSPACQNGGTCEVIDGYPVCICPNGYTGPLCEEFLNLCVNGGSVFCLQVPNSQCVDITNQFICQCLPGYLDIGTACVASSSTAPILSSTTTPPIISPTVHSIMMAMTSTNAPTATGTTSGQTKSGTMLGIVIGASVGGSLLIMVITIGFLILVFVKFRGNSTNKRMPSQMYTIDRNPDNVNDIYDDIDDVSVDAWDSRSSNVPPPVVARRDNWEVEFSQLELKQKIGSGAYGKVYKALLSISEHSLPRTVAVKVLKDDADDNERNRLFGEIELMKSLEPHPHVIQLVGCCTTGENFAMIMEYCLQGNLKEYLIKNNSNFQLFPISRRESAASIGGVSYYSRASKNSIDNGTTGGLYVEPNRVVSAAPVVETSQELSLHALLSFGRQITLGMEYLSQHKIVHGDLAARNILVCKDLKAKISDFGLSTDIYEDPSCIGNGCKVPLRWMAIEAMIDKEFTTKSDVWSFGVVLWELFSLGSSPYPGLKNEEVLKRIANGYRLPKPENCPEFLYVMMLECWDEVPSKRPSFGIMREQLDSVIATTEEAEEYMLLVGETIQ